MQVVIFLICFILLGCGIGLDLPSHDSRFDSIRDQFVDDAAFFGRSVDAANIRISFGNPRKDYKVIGVIEVFKDPGEVQGVCFMIPKDSNEMIKTYHRSIYGTKAGEKFIIIDKSFENRSAEEIEFLIYHELGHCALNLPHKEDQVIMRSQAINEDEYTLGKYRYFRLQEMFWEEKEFPPLGVVSSEQYRAELEPIYEVDYEAFGEKIKNKIFYDQKKDEYLLGLDGIVVNKESLN